MFLFQRSFSFNDWKFLLKFKNVSPCLTFLSNCNGISITEALCRPNENLLPLSSQFANFWCHTRWFWNQWKPIYDQSRTKSFSLFLFRIRLSRNHSSVIALIIRFALCILVATKLASSLTHLFDVKSRLENMYYNLSLRINKLSSILMLLHAFSCCPQNPTRHRPKRITRKAIDSIRSKFSRRWNKKSCTRSFLSIRKWT